MINSTKQWLNKSYYLNTGLFSRLKIATLFALFVFVFLFFFKPFGLIALGTQLPYVTLGFGLVTFVLMVIINIVIPKYFPRFFAEEFWTVKKELFYNTLNVFTIGVGNAIYSTFIGIDNLSFFSVSVYVLYTVSIALFPITISVLFKEALQRNKYEKQSADINANFHQVSPLDQSMLTINGQNQGEALTLRADELLFVRAADNYVELLHRQAGSVKKTLFRASLKQIEEQLLNRKEFWRCHKSYLVNTEQVERVSGNAQGFKLHISNSDFVLPVSRTNNQIVKSRLEQHLRST